LYASLSIREAFVPFLEKSFEEVFKVINYHQDDIRKAAIAALRQFCICFNSMNSPEGRVGEWWNFCLLKTYLFKSVCVVVCAVYSPVCCFMIFNLM
jgi:hypothetical protein